MNTEHSDSGSVAISLFLLALKKQKVSSKTVRAYGADLRRFFQHLKLLGESFDISALQKIRPEDIESHLKSLTDTGLKYSTIKRSSAAIRRYFSYLVEQGIITDNPAKSLTVKRVANNALTNEQLLSLFAYLIRHQHAGNESDIIRYRRDEVILLLMILHGIRQYHLGGLKLSQLQKTGNGVSLTIRKGFTIKLDGIVLLRLREYLSIRKSNADRILLDPSKNRPVNHSTVRTIMTELGLATRIKCSLKILYQTYLHLQHNPEERLRLLELFGRERLAGTYGAVSNA